MYNVRCKMMKKIAFILDLLVDPKPSLLLLPLFLLLLLLLSLGRYLIRSCTASLESPRV